MAEKTCEQIKDTGITVTRLQKTANKENARNGDKTADAHWENHAPSRHHTQKNTDSKLKPDKDPNLANATKETTAKKNSDNEKPITATNEIEIKPINNAIIVTTLKEDMPTTATATTITTTTAIEITTTDTMTTGINTINDQDHLHQTDHVDNQLQDDVYHNTTTDAITSHTTIDAT